MTTAKMPVTSLLFSFLVASLGFMLVVSPAHAQLAPQLSFVRIVPKDFANSTVLSVGFDAQGNLFASDGQFLSTVPLDGSASTSEALNPPIMPFGVATAFVFDTADNLYLADFLAGRILIRAPGGTFTTFANSLPFIRGMKFNSQGELVVIGGNANINTSGYVKRISATGVVTPLIDNILAPAAVAVDGADTIFVLTWFSNLYRITGSGEPQLIASFGGFPTNEGNSLAVDQNGSLFVGLNTFFDPELGMNTSELLRLTPAGQVISLGTNIDDGVPVGLAVAPLGDLVTADRNRARDQRRTTQQRRLRR